MFSSDGSLVIRLTSFMVLLFGNGIAAENNLMKSALLITTTEPQAPYDHTNRRRGGSSDYKKRKSNEKAVWIIIVMFHISVVSSVVSSRDYEWKNHSGSSIIVPELYCFVFISKWDNE